MPRPRRLRSILLPAVLLFTGPGCFGLFGRGNDAPDDPGLRRVPERPYRTPLEEWTATLRDPEAPIPDRRQAARGLANVGKDAVPVLIEALRAPEAFLRCLAADALARIGPGARTAADALTEALGDPDWNVRQNVAVALARLGPWAKGAIPSLITALKDPEPIVRHAAAKALARLGEAATPSLIEAQRDRSEVVRAFTAWALGEIGPEARIAIPALQESTHDPDPDVRAAAEEALVKIR